ncbi:MAG TPA: PPK2 family polyphosphate kinase [Candidatus Kapabacteria bacterium]|nr:PPK2 family polyphosphate kinase [Candidatus Kapabacteria bacterium]
MIKLSEIPTTADEKLSEDKAKEEIEEFRKKIYKLQNLLYANRQHALLIVLQGMDAAGKDGTIRHVFSSVNPQGCRVQTFKVPSAEEASHDFLWRVYPHIPEKGMMQIFNRSHYEDVLVPLVHGEIEPKAAAERIRFINEFERHLLTDNIIIIKFYLHLSHKEQKKRIDERLSVPEKRWKYDPADKRESKKWDEYMTAYERVLNECGPDVPWIVVPADDKWFRNYTVAKTIVETLEKLKMKYPG